MVQIKSLLKEKKRANKEMTTRLNTVGEFVVLFGEEIIDKYIVDDAQKVVIISSARMSKSGIWDYQITISVDDIVREDIPLAQLGLHMQAYDIDMNIGVLSEQLETLLSKIALDISDLM